jgi:hypothetical protein
MTNSFEGSNFVSVSDALGIPAYIQNLFPTLDESDVQAAVKQYEGLGLTDEAIKIGIMGEGGSSNLFSFPPGPALYSFIFGESTSVNVFPIAIFICPTYFLLQAFQTKGRPGFKGELAIPPGSHGEDIEYYFTS